MDSQYNEFQEEQAGADSARWPWRRVSAAIAATLGISAIWLVEPSSSNWAAAPELGPSFVNASSLNVRLCQTDTGGTCKYVGCFASRGPTQCVVNDDEFKCLCKPGFCALNGACVADDICVKETGGACKWLGCAGTRGPTDCVAGVCTCKPGYCANQGRCIKDGTCDDVLEGSSCRFLNCFQTRGPATCTGFPHYRCKCMEGYCGQNGACVMNVTSVVANVVPLDDDNRQFPVPHSEVRKGLAFGGGGTRANIVAMGVLRAFEDLQLTQHLDAIAACSGGSWAAGPWTFARKSKEELLGASTTPEELSYEVIQRDVPLIGRGATYNLVHNIIKKNLNSLTSLQTYAANKLWIEEVAWTYIRPSGDDLVDPTAFMAASDEEVAKIKRNNPEIRGRTFITPAPGRPKVLIITGLVMMPEAFQINGSKVVCLQMSPDYTGVPFYREGSPTIDYTPKFEDILVGKERPEYVVGGGLVESFAFGGTPPADRRGGPTGIELPPPERAFSLAKAVAISSSFFASGTGILKHARVQGLYWGIGGPNADEPITPTTFNFGDGGIIDSIPIHPLLQRGARKIVWVVATDVPIPTDVDFCSSSKVQAEEIQRQGNAEGKPAWAAEDLYDKFGFGECKAGFFRCHNQIFASDQLVDFLCDLQTLKAAGKPIVFRKTMRVLPNSYWQISGDYDIDQIVIYNDRVDDFEAKLPESTRKLLRNGVEFPHFPNYDLGDENGANGGGRLTAPQINLLSAQIEYSVKENAHMLHDLLGGGNHPWWIPR
mmetsp:Transcript_2794/g.7093  ORF Transcript_2794/g.7093 Transcript_2794/m.7093 type:complete len:770 (+) Transcript_2794:64-2373(+)